MQWRINDIVHPLQGVVNVNFQRTGEHQIKMKISVFFILKLQVYLASYTLYAQCQTIDEVNVLALQTASHKCYVKDPLSGDQYVKFEYKMDSTEDYVPLATCKVTPTVMPPKFVQGKQDSRYTSKLEFTNDGMVLIKNILPEDEAYFRCSTEGYDVQDEYRQTYEFVVKVFKKPTVYVVKTVDPLHAGSGKITAATCTAAEGRPDTAVVEWKTDTPLEYSQTNTSKAIDTVYTLDSELVIASPNQYYDGRPFTCRVTHPAFAMGDDSTGLNYVEETVTLNVTYPPTVPVISPEGTKLTCTSNGNPEPQFKWNMPAISQQEVMFGQSVEMISPEDPTRSNDTYECIAYNGYNPDGRANISTHQANVEVTELKQGNIGVIIGCIFGGLLLLALIVGLVYWFVIRKTDDGSGPYNKGKIYNPTQMQKYGDTSSSGARPTIQHANESINHNRPPSPDNPPPKEEQDSSSESDDHTEGDDVELAPRPSTRGITSKASINFQKDRKRPSTSPRSKTRPQYDQPPGYTDPRYEVPPGEVEDDRAHLTNDQSAYDEEPDAHLYDLPQDRYPEYYQDNGYDERYNQEYDEDNKPITYASLDDRYLGDPNTHRTPSEEHVEYAHIRPAYVV